MARIDSFLRLVVDTGASDFHLSGGSVPMMRHDGELVTIPFRVVSHDEAHSFILEIVSSEQARDIEQLREVDLLYTLEGVGRFRANVFQQNGGPAIVLRAIPDRVPTLESLGLPRALRGFAQLNNGLVLICGATGSGKSTTLAALVNEINANHQRHIITIEDPIEYVHLPLSSHITQRQVGRDTRSFAAALRSALREAPDVLVVGELRDPETMSLALAAAEIGALVFATLHTNSAARAVERFVDSFADDVRDQVRSTLSVLLRGIVAQRLLKRASGEGRIAVLEILEQSVSVSHMIRENKTHQIEAFLRGQTESKGSSSLDASLIRYLNANLITLDDALAIATDRLAVERAGREASDTA